MKNFIAISNIKIGLRSLSNFLVIVLAAFAKCLYGQAGDLQTLQDQFIRYQREHLQEKMFVHTDKSFYMAGEILWCKIYTVEATSNKPLDLSTVAYLELLDAEDKAALQTKIILKAAKGSGSLYLPASLKNGHYTLRAYTSWMKNAGAGCFFEKAITIINTLQPIESGTPAQPAAYDVQFFPEGGNLVNGLNSAVAFRVTDQTGRGVNFTGILIDSGNDTVAHFRPLKAGIGRFSLTPERGQKYRAIVSLPRGETITKDLIAAYEQGYVMHLNADTAGVFVNLNASSNLNGKKVYLLAHTRQSLKAAQEAVIEHGKATFFVDLNELGEGVSHFTVFNQDRQPLCERLYFKRPKNKLGINLNTDKKEYLSREQVTISLALDTLRNNLKGADLSVSVYQYDDLQPIDPTSIFSYLWLTSDLKGTVEDPDFYFDESNPVIEEATDNLMLTHGWRRFRWEDVLNDNKASFKWLPEINGHIITARVINNQSGEPAANVQTYLSIPGQATKFYESKSDSKGEIRYFVKNLTGLNEVVIQTDTALDSVYSIELNSPFSSERSSNGLPSLESFASKKKLLSMHSIDVQVQNIFFGKNIRQLYLADSTTSIFYGRPDKVYLLDEYVRFPTVELILREYVAEVGVRRRKGKTGLHVTTNEADKVLFEADPLILLDGVPVFDQRKILEYDPLKIKKVEVVTRKYYLGDLTYGGIINFSTYKGDLPDFQFDPKSLIIDYEGIQQQRNFYSPVYDTPVQLASRSPDFRNLLLWLPELKLNSNGSQSLNFYTSDQAGNFVVIIQGITSEGSAGNGTYTFVVRNPLQETKDGTTSDIR